MSYKPEPTIVYRPSYDPNFDEEPEDIGVEALPAHIKNVRMSLSEVFINRTGEFRSEIYVVSVVTDNLTSDPLQIELKTFENVRRKTRLDLGPNGVAIYRNPDSGTIPRFIDYRILVVESDEDMRDLGELIQEIKGNDSFKGAQDKITKAIAVGNPTAALVLEVSSLVVDVIAVALKMNKDDQLMYIAGSFDNAFENLGTDHGLIRHANPNVRVSYQVEAI